MSNANRKECEVLEDDVAEALIHGRPLPPDLAAARVTGKVLPGESGNWYIDRFTIDEQEAVAQMLRPTYIMTGRFVPPGTYTRLCDRRLGESELGDVVMSDTPDEIRDHAAILNMGHGRVLINGLGLGCVVHGLLSDERRMRVEHIDVVEKDEDVIKLMSPYLDDERVEIHHEDAFTIKWPIGSHWNCVWHDIWPELSDLYVPEITKLKQKYGNRCMWQGAWGERIMRDKSLWRSS